MVGGRSALAAEVPWTPLRPCFLNYFLEVGGAVTLPGHAGRLHEERLSLGLIELKPAGLQTMLRLDITQIVLDVP